MGFNDASLESMGTRVKSLYYCRSKSIQRASYAGVEGDNTSNWPKKILLKLKLIMRSAYHANRLDAD